MKRLVLSSLLVLIAIAISVSVVYAEPREEIRLTTIIPDQQVLRVKKGIISTANYRQATFPDNNIPASSLIVEGNVGIGTTAPVAKLEVYKDDPAISGGSNAFPSGNWAAKVFNVDDASNEGGLVVANRWADNSSTAFLVGGLYDGGTGFDTFLKVTGLGNIGIGTTNPQVKPGQSGFLDAKDVWLRDGGGGAGAWASQVAGTPYTGGKTVTFPNGLIMKMGYITQGANPTIINFATQTGEAFPTDCTYVMVIPYNPGGWGDVGSPVISAVSKTSMSISRSGSGGWTGYYWQAIGY